MQQQLKPFKNHMPDVNIVYYDKFGQSLTPKKDTFAARRMVACITMRVRCVL